MPEFDSLRSRADFTRVLKEGKRRRAGGLVLVELSGEPGVPRVGLVVSKSAGNAVRRNRIKRRLRHTLRTLSLEPGKDYVVIADARVADAPQGELVGWLRRAGAGSDDA